MKYSVRAKFNGDFVKMENGKITVGIKAKPENGKANDELIKKIAKHFKVSISSVRIVSGRTSKNKIVEII